MSSSKNLMPFFVISFFLTLASCNRDDDMVATNTESETTDQTNNPIREATLLLQSEFANTDEYQVVTDDIYAIWWEKGFDYTEDAKFVFQTLKNLRQDCLNNLEMKDPPNVSAGKYFNIYIHHNEGDSFPNEWANGVGTNRFDLPYMTLPSGAHTDFNNLLHEGFHVFQYSANSPGFEYSGDTGWYVESSAQWYAVTRNPGTTDIFIEIESITSNPHLALWHSFDNEAPGDPTDWLYQVRQYALQSWLYYMTVEEGVEENLVTNGFYTGTNLSPQEYHFRNVGADAIRIIFANWAARNTLDFDYLTRAQVARAKEELNNVADLNNRKPYAVTLDSSTILGTHQPSEDVKPRGWAYNVIKLENIQAGVYNIVLTGDSQGSQGAESHLEGRFVTKGRSEVQSFDMTSNTSGSFRLNLTETLEVGYLIVVAVPEHFTSYQDYNYQIEISQ